MDKMDVFTTTNSAQATLPCTKKILKPDNDEQAELRKHEILKWAESAWQIFSDLEQVKDSDGNYTKQFREMISMTVAKHSGLNNFSLNIQNQYRREYYTKFAEYGGVQRLCDLVINIVEGGITEDTQDIITLLGEANTILLNFSDNEINKTDLIMNHPTYVKFVISTLEKYTEDGVASSEQNPLKQSLIGAFLDQIHNFAMYDDNVARLRELGVVSVLISCMKFPNESHRLSCLAALADTVDEKESTSISTDHGILTFMLKTLEMSMKDPQHRRDGWSSTELARTVRRVARNDANKRLLVHLGVLEHLVNLTKCGDENEQEEAVEAMWSLAFDKENQNAMIFDKSCFPVDVFIHLRSSSSKTIRKICECALWTMREKLAESVKYKTTGKYYLKYESKASPQTRQEKAGHVMISYQWGNQKMALAIYKDLCDEGIRAWIDVKDLRGSIYTGMAYAVENADAVLLCYSRKYKGSSNCRAEAEYAFENKKKIIPLKMEKNYKPDGWLGIIIGSKYYYDFSGKYPYESKIKDVLKELSDVLGNDEVDEVIVSKEAKLPADEKALKTSVTAITNDALKWKPDQVATWLTKHKIASKRCSSLTGVEVAFLQVVLKESPDSFYKIITKTMEISDLLTMSKLRFALSDTAI